MKKNSPGLLALLLVLTAACSASVQPMSPDKADEALLYSTAEIIEFFREDQGRYPAKLEELQPPKYYFNKDTRHNPPQYRPSADGKGFDLIALGADGKLGTGDDISYDPAKRADNTLPMYGGSAVVKTPFQLELDQKFIQQGIQGAGSREKACQDVIKWGWEKLNAGDSTTAMKRFNQAWLLDPSNPEVFKGFAAVLKKQGKTQDAERMEGMIPKK